MRGLKDVHKKLLIQAAACNLALLMRSLYGAGKPKAAHDFIFAILALQVALELTYQLEFALFGEDGGLNRFKHAMSEFDTSVENDRFRHGLLAFG